MSRGRVRSDERRKKFVPDGREGLGKVVRDVAKAFDVSHGELQLGNSVLNPIKAGQPGPEPGAAAGQPGDDPISETHGDLIVAMCRRGGLGYPKSDWT